MAAIILIPARMASTRLPGKPLALIAGEPMIVHVWRLAVQSGIGEVVVACDGEEIAAAIRAAGGRAVLTDPDLLSGSDRIWQALQQVDPQGIYDMIVNVQGDMPTLDPCVIRQAMALLNDPGTDIGTLVAEITDAQERNDPAVVKAVLASPSPLEGEGRGGGIASMDSFSKIPPHPNPPPQGGRELRRFRALYFSRSTVPSGDGPLYHHIGLYAYRRAALEKFIALPASTLELREKLEQLRALEAGMTIRVAVVDTVPLGVDTPETLEKARRIMQ